MSVSPVPSSQPTSAAVGDEHSIRSPGPAVYPTRRHSSGIPLTPFDPISETNDKQNDEPSQELADVAGIHQHIYMTLSYMLGFKERWSLSLFIISAGAIIGFVLARSFMMDPSPSNVKKNIPPGEWFWNHRTPYRGALIAHVFTCFFIAWGVVFQFIPAIRRSYVVFHRVNGYCTLLLIPAGAASGWVVARRAFGGKPVTQALFYILGLLTLVTGTLGMTKVSDTRQHRKWMLRMASLLEVVISARIIMLATRAIISDIGTFYELFSCHEILYLTGSVSKYPSCVVAQQAGMSLDSVYVGIKASMGEAKINAGAAVRLAFPIGLWTALFIHIIGIELYIHLTEKQNLHREGYILTRDDDSMTRATKHDGMP